MGRMLAGAVGVLGVSLGVTLGGCTFVYKERGLDHLQPSDVLLVVEVLSRSNRGHDLVTKRHYYAVAGIPHYWIADPDEQTLTILTRNDDGQYEERAVLRPGDSWKTDEPFPLTIDPAEIF
jgi:Uma2 family endonuclease